MPEDWTTLARILLVGPLGYCAMIVLLRLSGKRALARMSAFDFVVTISMGAILANIVLARTPLLTGLLGLSVLIASQHVLTELSRRYERMERLVKGEPTLLFHDGRMLERAMRRERVTAREIRAVARGAGHPSLDSVGAVILEADGQLSVVGQGKDESALRDTDPAL